MSLQQSTSQTFGPYFHIGLNPIAVRLPAGAKPVVITGRVLDGDGKPVSDAAIETWQADLTGAYPVQPTDGSCPATSTLAGLGRAPTDAEGRFRIDTYLPGRVAAPGGAHSAILQAPHVLVTIGMRGLLKHLVTRIYFPGEASNAEDPVLKLVPAERRDTLIARAAGGELQWDVVLQGAGETVFFDC